MKNGSRPTRALPTIFYASWAVPQTKCDGLNVQRPTFNLQRSSNGNTGISRAVLMLGAGDRIGMFCHAHGHSMPAAARETAYAWLDRFLK